MSKLFQGYAVKTSEWIDMPRGTDLYEQAVKANAPIRILYESGKSYITQNQDKAIELGLMPSRKTKAAKPTKSKKSKTSKVKKSETNNPVLTMEGGNVVAINGKSCFF
mgnify:FL=1|jgi:hypothetical protein|tara:strand:- start:3704 stop:4027 length:324 start_codon:yes stop_codon:yes gene_type:complete